MSAAAAARNSDRCPCRARARPDCASSVLETEIATGIVRWFNPTKGSDSRSNHRFVNATSRACRLTMLMLGSMGKERSRKCWRSSTPDGLKCQLADPNARTRTMTVIEYKGHRIEVSSVGKGWRASIFSAVPPVHGQIVRPILKKVARRRLLPRPNALSKHA